MLKQAIKLLVSKDGDNKIGRYILNKKHFKAVYDIVKNDFKIKKEISTIYSNREAFKRKFKKAEKLIKRLKKMELSENWNETPRVEQDKYLT